MKGALELTKNVVLLVIILAVAILVLTAIPIQKIIAAETFGMGDYQADRIENGGGEASPMVRYPTDNLPLADNKIGLDNDFFVSEIACDITKDIYIDFITNGEYRSSLLFTDMNDAFTETSNMKCEYSTDMNDFVCIVGFGSFILGGDKTLTDVDLQELRDEGCCEVMSDECGCTHDSRIEFKIDEVCVNEFLNVSEFEDGTFCTSSPERWLRLYDYDMERLKFGNNDCFSHPANTQTSIEGWDWDDPSTCEMLCDAEDTTLEKDYDRIFGFWADDLSSEYSVSDSFIELLDSRPIYSSGREEVLQDRNYFYTVLWFNNMKRYVVMFARVPHRQEDGGSFSSADEFSEFLDDFFGVAEARVTTSGIYWPELATVYNGTITLSSEINVGDLKSLLESKLRTNKGISVYVEGKNCIDENNCLNYEVESQIWGEWLQNYARTSEIVWEVSDETPVMIRKYPGGDTLPAGDYRLVVRNWYSGLFYDDTYRVACDVVEWIPATSFCNPFATGVWCKNEYIRDPGEKIIFSLGCPAGYEEYACCRAKDIFSDEPLYHYVIERYVDKSVILISTS